MMRIRNPEVVAAEVGGISFVVHDISEWRGMYKYSGPNFSQY